MKTTWQTALGGIALATSFGISAPAFAEIGDFNEWDQDQSGVVEFNEWDAGFNDENTLTSWDSDSDGMLSNNEFGEGVFESYDADNSGDWNDEEYRAFSDDAGDGGYLDV